MATAAVLSKSEVWPNSGAEAVSYPTVKNKSATATKCEKKETVLCIYIHDIVINKTLKS